MKAVMTFLKSFLSDINSQQTLQVHMSQFQQIQSIGSTCGRIEIALPVKEFLSQMNSNHVQSKLLKTPHVILRIRDG